MQKFQILQTNAFLKSNYKGI